MPKFGQFCESIHVKPGSASIAAFPSQGELLNQAVKEHRAAAGQVTACFSEQAQCTTTHLPIRPSSTAADAD
jgi:hypothetical protein